MRAAVLALLATALLATGCTASGQSTSARPVPEEVVARSSSQRIYDAAKDAFGVEGDAVLCELHEDGTYRAWSVRIVLDSIDSTEAVDRRACALLAAVAQTDESETPVIVSVVSRDLRFDDSRLEWGALVYQWLTRTDKTSTRGPVVDLVHAETSEPTVPPGPGSKGLFHAVPRGQLRATTADKLALWARSGMPELSSPPTP